MILPITHAFNMSDEIDITGTNGLGHSGLIVIRRTTSAESGGLSSSYGTTEYVIQSYSLDVSNIMLCDYNEPDPNTQRILTNVKIWGNQDISGNVIIHNTTEAIAKQTGALQVNGGGSISGNTFIGGNLVVTNITQSTDILGTTLSGALQISGGASIRGNTFIGGILHTDSPVIVNRPSQSIYPNALMDVSGNAIITRLGLNLSGSAFTNIDSDAILHINGNMVHNNGFIRQF